ncbi:MAG: element excision factor XisH family protein [Chloroflexota bacterium]
MAKPDIYHDVVKEALVKDGWTITHDPLIVAFGRHNLFVDLGAERILAAEKEGQQIAVEIKSFVGRSLVHDLELAIGQFGLYRTILKQREPDRILYLAIPLNAYDDIFNSRLGQAAIEDHNLRLIVFDPVKEVVRKWIN